MLDANTIMLDLDYIYVDVTTCEAELICLPIQRGNFNDFLLVDWKNNNFVPILPVTALEVVSAYYYMDSFRYFEQAVNISEIELFKNIIFSVTYDQTENCDYVAKIIGCLNSHSRFSLQNFMQTIDELNGKRTPDRLIPR